MTSLVYNITQKEPPVDIREALRYAGVRGDDETLEALAQECASELLPTLSYRVCYLEADINEPAIRNIVDGSASLSRALCGAVSVVIFAATVGIGPDRLVAKASVTSPARALMYQALGAERIEALCDLFCFDMAQRCGARGLACTRRFSPGYGDLSLEKQRDIFALLGCERQIGLTLNDSLLMSPTKSVSAIFGLCPKDNDPENGENQ